MDIGVVEVVKGGEVGVDVVAGGPKVVVEIKT